VIRKSYWKTARTRKCGN